MESFTKSDQKRTKADVYLQTLYALMLRDMRTRFGGSHVGFVIAVLWPVVHVFVLVGLFTLRGLPSPLSGGTAIFIATGAVPCLTFQYISREVMKGYGANKPLTYYPQVKIFDVIVSRILVETVSGFIGAIIVLAVLAGFGLNVLPADTFQAMIAYLAAMFLGIGIGFINVGIVSVYPGWAVGYLFLTILNYMLAGVVFMPSFLPEQIYYYFKFNPVVHIIELMRLAYEPSLPIEIDYMYITLFIVISILIGLVIERQFVRQMS